jgi:hypothetical protein
VIELAGAYLACFALLRGWLFARDMLNGWR